MDDLNTLFPATTDALPAYMRNDGELGNENVGAGDIAVPRLSLLQSMSPQCQDALPGCLPGKLYNTVSEKVADFVYVVNLYMTKEWTIFKKMSEGGGVFGSFGNEATAQAHVDTLPGDPKIYEIFEVHRHTVLVLNEQGEVDSPAEILMKSTNLKPSREWNNQIKTVGRGLPRFALVWKLTSEKKKSDKFSWYVFRTELAGQCPEPLYDEGKKLYQSLAGGKSLEEQYEEDAVPF